MEARFLYADRASFGESWAVLSELRIPPVMFPCGYSVVLKWTPISPQLMVSMVPLSAVPAKTAKVEGVERRGA